MMRKALGVGRKELRQILRDRRTLMILLFVPAFFLLLYGYALNWDIRHVALAVEDRDRTPASRALVSAFVELRLFRPRRRRPQPRPRSRDLMDRGDGARGRSSSRPAWRATSQPGGRCRCRCCSTATTPTRRRR